MVGTAWLIGSIERVSRNHYKISDGYYKVPLKSTVCVAGNINLINVPSSEIGPVHLKDLKTTSIKRGGHPKIHMVVLAGILLRGTIEEVIGFRTVKFWNEKGRARN